MFGKYITTKHVSSERVVTLSHDPTRVHFNWWDTPDGKFSVHYFSAEPSMSAGSRPQPLEPSLPTSLGQLPHPYTMISKRWIRTACSLQHIVEIQPCVKRDDPNQPVIGMLLCYADGHREGLGKVRLDWVVEPLIIRSTDKLRMRFDQDNLGRLYVATLTTGVPKKGDDDLWIDMPQNGILEWWFFLQRRVFFYQGGRVKADFFMRITKNEFSTQASYFIPEFIRPL